MEALKVDRAEANLKISKGLRLTPDWISADIYGEVRSFPVYPAFSTNMGTVGRRCFLTLRRALVPTFFLSDSALDLKEDWTCSVDLDDPQQVNRAAHLLWERRKEAFWAKPRSVELVANGGGDNYAKNLENLGGEISQVPVSWRRFCQFSRRFATVAPRAWQMLQGDLAYMNADGSPAFRAAWGGGWRVIGYDEDVVLLRNRLAVAHKVVNYIGDDLYGYRPEVGSSFYFVSSSGHQLVANVVSRDGAAAVLVSVSSSRCSYAKFLIESQG